MIRVLLAAVVAGAAAFQVPAALAQPPAPLTEVSARWTADDKVDLKVVYEGGACERMLDAEVTASEVFGTDLVTIPTVETAQACTMQMVEVEFTGTIAVEPTTETLSILVLDPQGQPKAAGSVEIAK